MDRPTSTPRATAGYPGAEQVGYTGDRLLVRADQPGTLATLTPLAMLGLGLAGGAAWLATRRRKKSLSERVSTLISERVDDGLDVAASAADSASELATQGRHAAGSAARTGWKLFKRGRAAAASAYQEASKLQEEGQHLVKKALKEGEKLTQKGAKSSRRGLHLRQQSAKAGARAMAQAGGAQLFLGLLAAALLAYSEHMRSQREALRA